MRIANKPLSVESWLNAVVQPVGPLPFYDLENQHFIAAPGYTLYLEKWCCKTGIRDVIYALLS